MSKNRNRNPEMVGRIHVPGKAMEQLQAERGEQVSKHITELNTAMSVQNSAVNAVVLASIQHGGLPADPAAHFAKCKEYATLIADDQLVMRAERIRDLLKDLNIHQAQPALEWACAQVGVELFPEAEKPAEESKIIQ